MHLPACVCKYSSLFYYNNVNYINCKPMRQLSYGNKELKL